MPEYPDSLVESVRAMSRFLVGDEVLDDALRRIAELAVEATEPADFAGITLDGEHGPRTAAFTDRQVPEIEQAQYDTGIGPCLEAWRNNRVLRIDSTEHDARWNPFNEAARNHGILSTLSVPLAVDDTTAIGALNLYARRRSAFDERDEAQAVAFAEQAAVLMTYAQAYRGGPERRPAIASELVRRTRCSSHGHW